MNLADIRAWLASSQDFTQGVALYAALGTSAAYKRLFTLDATDYSRQVLVRELSGIENQVLDVVDSVAQPAAQPEPPAAPMPAPEPHAPDSPLLVDLRQQLRAVRDERSQQHAQLTAKGVGQKRRRELAGQIVALTAQEVTLKSQVAHVLEHGRLPGPVATAEVSDPVELKRRLLNLRSRRSKAKNEPEKLVAIEAEITLIQSKLKA